MEIILALDFGTQGVKALLVNAESKLLEVSQVHYGFSCNQNGWMEQRPQDWENAAVQAIAALKQKRPDEVEKICAIGLSGHMHGIVAMDAKGLPLYDCILWCDTRSAEQMAHFHSLLTVSAQERLRNPFATAYSAGKLLWLREKCPDRWAKLETFLFCKDYIRYRLTGEMATDYCDASGSLLYNFDTDGWDDEACRAIGFSACKLPPILSSSAIAGKVTPQAAQKFQLKAGIPVAVGTGDLAASLLGSGVSAAREALINLGTAGQVLALAPRGRRQTPGGYQFKFSDAQTDMILFALPTAAYCARWFVERICPFLQAQADAQGISVFSHLHSLAAQSPAGANDLLFAPWLSGTGSPYQDDAIRGAWIGLDSSHTYQDLARAMLEGVAMGIRQCIDAAGGTGQFDRICLAGGGAKSYLWRTMISCVLNSRLFCPVVSEAAGMGAAKLAMRAVGLQTAASPWIGEYVAGETMETAVYQRLYAHYEKVYGALKTLRS